MSNFKFIFLLLLFAAQTKAQTINITGPAGSGQFGKTVTVLLNGNYVVADPLYDEGAITDVGAVYLYNGVTHTLISTLKGSTANDQVGSGVIIILSNGNYLVSSSNWDNGTAVNAGAVTWCSGISGVSGLVSSSNSLVGSKNSDNVGSGGIMALDNGNYVVSSLQWDNGTATDAGAVTWGNGLTGITGNVSNSNSLVGSVANDIIGMGGITVLGNGNFIVRSPSWHNGLIVNAGAVTWCSGSTGITGAVTFGNSLIGSRTNDNVGSGGITVLNNGNYVVKSPNWNNASIGFAGAVTWGSGTSGATGTVNSGNSLVGVVADDRIGSGGVTALSNGNYLVISPFWDNGIIKIDAGAVTWCNGSTGFIGVVNSSNSLVGNTVIDRIGSGGVTALSNGNYVVSSPNWDNGAISNAGAVTWANGSTGITGIASSSNSLIGNTANDQIGSMGVTALINNGNYVVSSPSWDNGLITDAGAVTWADGSIGIVGVLSSSNSLVGSTINDQVGGILGITALDNGNYVVSSPNWDNGEISNAGAATWCNGSTGLTGVLTVDNSLVGTTAGDRVSSFGIRVLNNGNYVIPSTNWDNGGIVDVGAITWASGTTGVSGHISINNSLVGSSAHDQVGLGGEFLPNITALSNGNYVVGTLNWDNGAAFNAGAVTWCNGYSGTAGVLNSNNSLVGNKAGANLGYWPVVALSNGNYVVRSPEFDNGTATYAGSVTWGNGTSGVSGVINSNISLVGSTSNDAIGASPSQVADLGNGHYVVFSQNWDNGITINAGAITFGVATGIITSCNSVLGTVASGGSSLTSAYNAAYNYLIVGRPSENIISIFNPESMTMAEMQDSITQNIYTLTATPLIASVGCRIIATLTPNGASPVSSAVKAKVWVESSLPTYGGDPFVARHYEITPVTNASTATAKVTLYFTQQEFDDFNNHPGSLLNLPTDDADVTGIANLRIGKYHGASSNGSGLPITYSGSPIIIDPNDADIIWNGGVNRWEVSFDVTGFSGFIVQTKATIIPLNLLDFYATHFQNDVLLTWKTTNEINTHGFEVERSTDGRSFTKAGAVAAINSTVDQTYDYIDAGAGLLHTNKLYYRLKIVDKDGSYSNSSIVLLHLSKNNSFTVYPNPVTNITTLSFGNKALINTTAVITDMLGKQLRQFIISNYQQQINISHFANGVYILKLEDGTAIKIVKN